MISLSLSQLESRCASSPLRACISGQITALTEKLTKSGKPYLDLTLSDAATHINLKLWEDTPAFSFAKSRTLGVFVLAEATWTQNEYGINADRLELSELDAAAVEQLLGGDPEQAAFQQSEWDFILKLCASLSDPRLKRLCDQFIKEFGEQLRRTAAARTYHHARRGGLIEHIAQMMRTAEYVCMAYPELNRDLMLAGVLFHDCGKLWENRYEENGFAMPYRLEGELLGHIPLGLGLVDQLWQQLEQRDELPESGTVSNHEVKLHLQHLIASHHGEYAFGSPTLPKTPEAAALHYIDNLDAKLQMFREGYKKAPALNDQIFERHRPLPGHLVRPLPPYSE